MDRTPRRRIRFKTYPTLSMNRQRIRVHLVTALIEVHMTTRIFLHAGR